MSFNEAIATGRAYLSYDLLEALKELQAAIGYHDGYVIHLGKSTDAYLFRKLADTIAFHEGGDTLMSGQQKGE